MTRGPQRAASRELPTEPGIYVLRFDCRARRSVAVGRLGMLELRAGVYLYVGSAHGPGGLQARVGRHLAGRGRRHWHVDHLRSVLPITRVWTHLGSRSLEHDLAARLADLPGARVPLPGFGSSDCLCASHLVLCPPGTVRAATKLLARASGQSVPRDLVASPGSGA